MRILSDLLLFVNMLLTASKNVCFRCLLYFTLKETRYQAGDLIRPPTPTGHPPSNVLVDNRRASVYSPYIAIAYVEVHLYLNFNHVTLILLVFVRRQI